jgi:hypothetical protein
MVASSPTKQEKIIDQIAKNVAALCMNGRKKFFVKIYGLCKDDPQLLLLGIVRAQKIYTPHHNPTHALKSLVYFSEAEPDPMPTLFFKANWEVIKKYFQTEVTKIAKDLLGLQ